jgi:hypothetical protein
MKTMVSAACLLWLATAFLGSAFAQPTEVSGILIFEDDFEPNESLETREETGKGWETNCG